VREQLARALRHAKVLELAETVVQEDTAPSFDRAWVRKGGYVDLEDALEIAFPCRPNDDRVPARRRQGGRGTGHAARRLHETVLWANLDVAWYAPASRVFTRANPMGRALWRLTSRQAAG